MSTLVFDTEIYSNYFLIMFMDIATERVRILDMYPGKKLPTHSVVSELKNSIVSFNGNSFDIPIISVALSGANCSTIKQACDDIILHNMMPWNVEKKYKITVPEFNHIDLINVAPGIASLKMYGGRMHCATIRDLPFAPGHEVSVRDRVTLRKYCLNDLRLTKALFWKLKPKLDLRKKMGESYGLDLMCKSDAQIAEAVIRSGVESSTGRPVKKVKPGGAGSDFTYSNPEWVSFKSDKLKSLLNDVINTTFKVPSTGSVIIPHALKHYKITIGATGYRMGIGGLHSMESRRKVTSDAGHILIDRDVVSYYPAILLSLGMSPKRIGNSFMKVYSRLVDLRLTAKRAGDKDTSDSLKITINGTFGKLNNRYSIMYDPKLFIAVTVTGQLALLMLIEMIELVGIHVISANTDGVVINCPRKKETLLNLIMLEWERTTGFDTSEMRYSALYSRDVNTYVALREAGSFDTEIPDVSIKSKGLMGAESLMRNPTNLICINAVIKFLAKGVPVEDTINGCDDATKFTCLRNVSTGAVLGGAHVKGAPVSGGKYIGKAIRWYYSTERCEPILYAVNGNKVPRTDGAKLIMTLPYPDDGKDYFRCIPHAPYDVDRSWYIREAYSILSQLGADNGLPLFKDL